MRMHSRRLARFAAAGVLGVGLIGSLVGAAEASTTQGAATGPTEVRATRTLPADGAPAAGLTQSAVELVATTDCPDPGDSPALPALPALPAPPTVVGSAVRDDVTGGPAPKGASSVEVRDGKVFVDGKEVAAMPSPAPGTPQRVSVAIKDGKVYVGDEAEAVAGVPALPAVPAVPALPVPPGGEAGGNGDGPDRICVAAVPAIPGTTSSGAGKAVPVKP